MKIVQITASVGKDGNNYAVFGLGDDGKIYTWDFSLHKWV